MKIKSIALLTLVFPIISNANSDSCNALLNVGLYNTTIASSATDAHSLALSTFCSFDYNNSFISSAQSAQIEASYGLFSGGAGGSANRQEIITKQSQVCTSGFNSSAYSNKASSYSQSVYQGTLDAWNKCQQIANKGLVFEVQPTSTMQGIGVSITAPSGFDATFFGVNQIGSGTSKCTINENGNVITSIDKNPFKFTASSKVTVICKRNMDKHGNDLSADQQDLIFVTSADNLTVPLPAIGAFSRVTADKIKEDAITSSNNTANQNAQTLFSQINNSTTSLVSSLQSQITSLQNGVALTTTIPKSVANAAVSGCIDGPQIDCAAAAHRYCLSQGYKGGFPQEWDGTNITLICVK
ncbi:hypothetical protein [Methylomonas sp. 11b]|uniref:hypothetical protein n=1 Tax=Methylomonas sp. 11b TaxID=1168169 RepID=UPI0004B755E2|nr:hypothetical protein [Methylomonas sp. 11b]